MSVKYNNYQYDVIVVGLGAMGSATLYQLAKRGVHALGIDQYETPHRLGSTHGETRITRLAVGEGEAYIPIVRRSHEIWRELEAHSGEQLLIESGGYIISPKEGGAHFHGAGNFVTSSVDLARRHGIEYRLLGGDELRRCQPLLKVTDNEQAFFEPSGGVVNPEQAVRIQLTLALEQGAAIRSHEKVLTCEPMGRGIRVRTDVESYQAARVILTTGPWIADLLPQATRDFFSIYRQVFYWFEAEDLAPFHSERFPWLIWIGQEQADFYSIFPTPEGATQAVKMVTEEYIRAAHPNEVDREVKDHEIERMYQQFIKTKVRGILPNCIQSHVCLYTTTPDQHFVIDYHPASDRIVLASACSGHGFKHSPAIGEALAQLALDNKCEIDRQPFRLSRFTQAIEPRLLGR